MAMIPRRRFETLYRRAERAYKADDPAYERFMDDLALKCSEEQWAEVGHRLDAIATPTEQAARFGQPAAPCAKAQIAQPTSHKENAR